MIRLFTFIYIMSTLVWFTLGNGSERAWQGFNILSMLIAIILFAWLVCLEIKVKALNKVWLLYVIGVTIARIMYTALCIYAPITWVYEKTNYFTVGLCVSFICLLIYTANTYKD